MGGPVKRLAWAALALDLVGAQMATRHRLVAEPFGLPTPGRLPAALVIPAWGTALSGPLVADAALLAMAPAAELGAPRARRAVSVLAALRLVGVFGEPVSWGRRPPRRTMLVAAAHVILGVALLRSATARRPRSLGP
jgi:hypothetical protein